MTGEYVTLARRSWVATLALMAALQVVYVFETLLLPTFDRPANPVVWAVQALPLAAFVPGMLARKPRIFIWLCFLLLIYFAVAVLSVFTHPHGFYSWAELLLISSLYVASMLFARWRHREMTAVGPAGDDGVQTR